MKIKVSKFISALVFGTLLVGSATCAPWFSNKGFKDKSSINVLSREEGSGTRGAFIELFGIEKKDANGVKTDYTTVEAGITNSTAVMLTSVAGDKYSIGYVSLGSLNDSVKALKIDGADATVANIKNGTYKVSRPFNIAIKKDINELAKDFISFILSKEGQKVVEANKYIAVDSDYSYTPSNVSGKISVAGSSSVSPVMEKLIEEYKKLNPKAVIELQTSDSTTGVNSAIEGICDIGMASRKVKDSEIAKGVTPIEIAIDGIAVIVNNQNPKDELSKEDVEKIFTGKVEKWNKI